MSVLSVQRVRTAHFRVAVSPTVRNVPLIQAPCLGLPLVLDPSVKHALQVFIVEVEFCCRDAQLAPTVPCPVSILALSVFNVQQGPLPLPSILLFVDPALQAHMRLALPI